MCGIAGIICKNSIDLEGLIKTMLGAIPHRGPDGDGYLIEKHLALGHKRLSIIDLSENASQPMNFNNVYDIVFNGEIYNYLEIRDILKTEGYFFKTQSDTEVILAAYDFWGTDCVNQFNGMWSFALYDRHKNTIFCARDRFGIKPFYYTQTDDAFYFASEIKQLLSVGIPAKANHNTLLDYLVLGIEEHTQHTFFENISKLPASHTLTFDLTHNKYNINKYYTLKINPAFAQLSQSEALNLFEKEMNRSINYRLRSDVKVGTCLSGGLDSSLIATIASKAYAQNTDLPFSAFTASSVDKKNDETNFARIVAEQNKLDWFTTTPSKEDFLACIKDVISNQDEPFGSPSIFMQYFVFKTAKEQNCTVLLDGQGGDEMLLGYERYYLSYILTQPFYKKPYAIFKTARNSKLGFFNTLKYLMYFKNHDIRKKHLINRMSFLNKKAFEKVDFSILKKLSEAASDIKNLQILEITQTQLPHLLKYEDRNSMFHSIETRLPFLDYQLVELMISLPFDFKIKDGWTKFLLRKLADKHLPSSIAWRKNKFGFEAPEDIWLNDHAYIISEIKKSNLLKEYINGTIPTDNKRVLWRLFNIAIWEKCLKVE